MNDVERQGLMHEYEGRDETNEPELIPISSTKSSHHSWLSRCRLFVQAIMYLGQVLVDIGRRGLRCIELNVPRYIGLVDRCLVYVIRVTVHPRKNVSALRLLLALCLVASIPYVLLTMYRLQRAVAREKFRVVELTETLIRPHIIVESIDPPTKKVSLLRHQGPQLQIDDVTTSCVNTVQGMTSVTDSAGYLCLRSQMDSTRRGCCNVTQANVIQFACERCDTNAPHCCDVYEHCVSCCMSPLHKLTLRQDYLTHADPSHPIYRDPSSLTLFQYCQFRCRTSSSSVQHQNSYRSRRTYCYGIHRPRKTLATVNSDATEEETQDTSEELELDLYYLV